MEDSIDLTAKLPGIASLIYRNTYKHGNVVASVSNLDWTADLSHMMVCDTTLQIHGLRIPAVTLLCE